MKAYHTMISGKLPFGCTNSYDRKMLNRFGYQITTVLAIEALFVCKTTTGSALQEVQDNFQLDNIIKAKINMTKLIQWVWLHSIFIL